MAKILIIEDSPTQAAIIQEIVENSGHEGVVWKDFGKGMHQILGTARPDLVLLDLVLLDENGNSIADGFQLCREIKRISKGKVGVVIVSSKDDSESVEWAKLQGADAFIQKPFVVQDLLVVIHEVLSEQKRKDAAKKRARYER